MYKQKKIFLLFITWCLMILSAFILLPVSAGELSNEEIIHLVSITDKNLYPPMFKAELAMKDYKEDKVIEKKMVMFRKDDKVIGVFTDPPIQKGQAIIRDGDNMWMYLPKSMKVTRIGVKDKSLGGEASNADLFRVDLERDYDAAYLGKETINNTLYYKLELKAKRRTIAYDRVLYWISVDKNMPLKREYYSLSGMLLKTMFFEDVIDIAGRTRPAKIIVVNEQNKKNKSEIITVTMNTEINLEDFMFSPNYIKQGKLEY